MYNIKIKNIDVFEIGVRGRNSDNTLIKEKLGWCPTLKYLESWYRKNFSLD